MSNPLNTNVFVLKRGIPVKNPFRSGSDFSGISYHVRFQSSKGINLHGLGFTGLHEKSPGRKILLTTEIRESRWNKSETSSRFNGGSVKEFLSKRIYLKEPELGKEFFLRFSDPVILPSNVMIDISFQIDPAIVDKNQSVTLRQMRVTEPLEILQYEAGVTFNFMSSSNAVTGLYFAVPN